jgi:ankyrin repeat protein
MPTTEGGLFSRGTRVVPSTTSRPASHSKYRRIVQSTLDRRLLAAVKNRNYKLVKLLLKLGANVNVVNVLTETPLYLAIRNVDFKIVALLLDNGADPSIPTNREKPINLLEGYRDLKIIDALLKRGEILSGAILGGNYRIF